MSGKFNQFEIIWLYLALSRVSPYAPIYLKLTWPQAACQFFYVKTSRN